MLLSHKISIYFFNFQGILSFKTRDNSFTISKLMIIFNFILTPVLSFLMGLVSPSTILESFNLEVFKISSTSMFSLIMITSLNILYSFIAACIIYIQLWKQKKIIVLMQNSVKVFKFSQIDIEHKIYKELRRKSFETLVKTWLLGISWNLMYFIVLMKFNFKSCIIFEISNWNLGVPFYFVAFVNLFFNFFIALLKSFRSKLEHSEINFYEYEKIVLEYSNIYKLVTEFNNVLGLLLSLSVAFLVSFSTIRVIFQVLIFFKLKMKMIENFSSTWPG